MQHIFDTLEILEGDDKAVNEYINSILVADREGRDGLPKDMFNLLCKIQAKLDIKQTIQWTYK